MITPLHKLTFTQHSLLKASGLMQEVYPHAACDYDTDVPSGRFEIPAALADKIKIEVYDTEFICSFRDGWGQIDDDLMPYASFFRSGEMQGGGRSFSNRGKTRYDAFSAFFDRIKGSHLVSESKSSKDRSREIFYVESDLVRLISIGVMD